MGTSLICHFHSPDRVFIRCRTPIAMISISDQDPSSHQQHQFKRPRPRAFKNGLSRALIPALFFSLAIVCGQTALFVVMRSLPWLFVWKLVAWAVIPGLLLTFVIPVLEGGLLLMKEKLVVRFGQLLSGFILFFLHVIGYLLVSSLLISFSMGWLIQAYHLGPEMAKEYGLFSANVFILFGGASWLRNMVRGKVGSKGARL